MFDRSLISELAKQKIKHNPDNIVAIARAPKGRIVFLETGNKRSGLEHIVDRHGKEFVGQGVSASQIPELIMTAVTSGIVVGTQGSRMRPVYEVVFNGITRRIAVEISDNGFIVSANPKSAKRSG